MIAFESLSDYLQYLFAISGIFAGVIISIYFLFFKNKLKVYILKKYRGGYRTVKFKRTSISKKELTVNKDKYNLNTNAVIENKRGTGMLFFQQGKANPLSFLKDNSNTSSAMLKHITESGVYSRLFGNPKEKTLTALVIILAVALIGVVGISFFVQMTLNNRIFELMQNVTRIPDGVIIG